MENEHTCGVFRNFLRYFSQQLNVISLRNTSILFQIIYHTYPESIPEERSKDFAIQFFNAELFGHELWLYEKHIPNFK